MFNLKTNLLELFMTVLTRVHWRRLFSEWGGFRNPNLTRTPWVLNCCRLLPIRKEKK